MVDLASATVTLTEKILGHNAHSLSEILKLISKDMGLSHIAHLGFLAERSEDITVLTAVNTYPIEWQARYFLKNYKTIDPVVRFGVQATEPFDWDTLGHDDPTVQSFFADAVKHDVGRNGLTIPVRNRKFALSLVSFSSELHKEEWQVYKADNLIGLQHLSVLIDSAASADRVKLPKPVVQLSKREEECLAWAAKGRTQHEIAQILDLSLGSVKAQLDSARRKLNCKNLAQAVGVAVAAGVISPDLLGDANS